MTTTNEDNNMTNLWQHNIKNNKLRHQITTPSNDNNYHSKFRLWHQIPTSNYDNNHAQSNQYIPSQHGEHIMSWEEYIWHQRIIDEPNLNEIYYNIRWALCYEFNGKHNTKRWLELFRSIFLTSISAFRFWRIRVFGIPWKRISGEKKAPNTPTPILQISDPEIENQDRKNSRSEKHYSVSI